MLGGHVESEVAGLVGVVFKEGKNDATLPRTRTASGEREYKGSGSEPVRLLVPPALADRPEPQQLHRSRALLLL